MPNKIEGVEVLAVGSWNGDPYTRKDLEDMVANADKLGFTPPVKLGHTKSPGEPAYGWVQNLRLSGDRLLADFVDLPTAVYEAIRDRRYDHVSSEIWWNVDRGGQKLRRAIKAVALLGSDVPAVAGLKPLREVFHDAEEIHGEVRLSQSPAIKEDEKTMPKTLEELQSQVTSLEAQVTTLKTERDAALAKATEAEKKLSADEDDDEDQKTKDLRASLSATQEREARRVRDGIVDKVRVPALKPYFKALAAALVTRDDLDGARTVDLSVKDGQTEKVDHVSLLERMADQVGRVAKVLSAEMTSGLGGDRNSGSSGLTASEASDEVDRRVADLQSKDPKISYRDARSRVLAADEDLKKAYAA